MAEETVDQMLIPEKIEFDKKVNENGAGDSNTLNHEHSTNTHRRRASISSNSTRNSSRRNSLETPNSPKIIQKPVPNYLRASTGSCHDFCKYGRKHEFEEKAKRPLMERLQKALPNNLDSVQILVSGEKKEKLVKQKSSIDTNKHSPDLNLSTDSRSRFPKVRTSLDAKTYRPNFSGNKTLLIKKIFSPDHPEIIKTEIRSPSKIDVPVKKNSLTGGKKSKTEERTDHNPGKYSYPSLKSRPLKVNATSSRNSDATHVKAERNRVVKSMRKIISSGRKDLALSAANSSPKLSLSNATATKARKTVNPLKDRSKNQRAATETTENEKVPEKTLHVIKTETRNDALELELELESNSNDNVIPSIIPISPSHASSSNGNSSYFSHEQDDQETEHSANDTDECSSDKKESMEICKKQSLEENKNKTLKKNKGVASEVKYRSPVKLKFRSGKVVDLHADSNTPRRLRFRRARILGADQVKGELTRKTFNKGGGDNGANSEEGLSSEKVSLKHQDVQGKKDERGLFNNVIEETASKLVESRKSKVKALVGAFETVISLQESKPPSHAVI